MFEIRTIFVSTFLIDLALAIVLLFSWWQHRDRYIGVGMWALSLVLPTVTLLLVSLRNILPDFISIVLALSLLPLGSMFMVGGIETFFGIKRISWIHYALSALFLPYLLFFTYVDFSIQMRVLGFNVITGIQYLIGVHVLQYRVKEEHRATGKLTSTILMLMACCNACRAYLALLGDAHPPAMATHPLDSIPLLFTQALTVVLVVSCLLMINQRHSSQLELANLEIERREKRYRAVVENSPMGIAVIDQEEIIILANAYFCRLLKLNQEDVIGKDFKQYIAPESRDNAVNIFRDRQSGLKGVPSSHEVALRGPSGRTKYIEVHGALLEKTDTYCHTLVQAFDITARKKSETALLDYQKNLEDMVHGRTSSVIRGSGADA